MKRVSVTTAMALVFRFAIGSSYRTPNMWFRTIIFLTPFMVSATVAHGSDEATATLECAEWANKVFFSPSEARDVAFIDCILKKSPFSDRMDLRHKLDTGEGDELLRRLATGEDFPPVSEHLGTNPPTDLDCPYLTVEVNTPRRGDDPDKRRASYENQKPYMEQFSAQLELVGFKVWESPWVLLERKGFSKLGAFWKRIQGPSRTPFNEREEAEYDKIRAKLTTHQLTRYEQILDEHQESTWTAHSDVLDIGGSEDIGLPEGDRILIWHWSMKRAATVLDGAIRIDLFTDPKSSESGHQFGSITDHLLVMESKFGNEATKAADWAAAVFLPHARQLCADMNATLLEEEAKLERIRDQLTEEIMRVRERRAEHEKKLELEVEQ